jgi:hypothetical protein
MAKLVISLATRGRPQQVVDTIQRSTANLVLPNTMLMVQVDEDDPATVTTLSMANLDSRVKVNVKPREDTIAAKWNRALHEPADLYLVAADDDPYVTPGYDAKLVEAARLFPDGIGMVYGHMANASFSGVVAPTVGLTEKLGHIFPELFPYWFVDHWTDDLARLIGRLAFADVRTDQSRAGKTQEMREPGWWATFFDAGYRMRRSIAMRIINGADFQTPDWQKDMLHSCAPLIEFRSKWINDNVRAQSRQLDGWSGLKLADPRYQRVKDAAIAMIPHLLNDYGMDAGEAQMYQRALIPPTTVVGLQRAFG